MQVKVSRYTLQEQKELNTKALAYAKEMEQFIVSTLYTTFTLQVVLDWSISRTCSRGGLYAKGPGINIAMAHIPPAGFMYRFYEYASYNQDKEIGGFYSSNPDNKLKAVIAHEIAHAVQRHHDKLTKGRSKPHGTEFKAYYKILRNKFVNSILPEQQPLKEAYNKYINLIG